MKEWLEFPKRSVWGAEVRIRTSETDSRTKQSPCTLVKKHTTPKNGSLILLRLSPPRDQQAESLVMEKALHLFFYSPNCSQLVTKKNPFVFAMRLLLPDSGWGANSEERAQKGNFRFYESLWLVCSLNDSLTGQRTGFQFCPATRKQVLNEERAGRKLSGCRSRAHALNIWGLGITSLQHMHAYKRCQLNCEQYRKLNHFFYFPLSLFFIVKDTICQ